MWILLGLISLGAFFGHGALWVALTNRLHATGLPRPFIKAYDRVFDTCLVLGGGLMAWRWWTLGFLWARPVPAEISLWSQAGLPSVWGEQLLAGYLVLCLVVTILVVPAWVMNHVLRRATPLLISNHTAQLDLAERLGHWPVRGLSTRILACVPGNEICRLHVHEKTLVLPRLPAELDGLTIAHFSDLHFTGRMEKAFYQEVVREANKLQADLVAVTGDIIDKARCITWIPDTLGQLIGPHGVYYVVGNHERRVPDLAAVRRTLAESGLVDLGSRTLAIQIRGCEVLLAGTEVPWFGTSPVIPPADSGPQRALRIVLSHSPDQIEWARRNDFDLLLAGHTHGGQIRFPWIGPITCPSYHGVKYAAGAFHLPPTLMHVSRGISGTTSIRLNCPPELTRLVLRCR